MSRKHFRALAEQIALIPDLSMRITAAHAVAEACRRLNPRFKMERFLRACCSGE